MKNKRAMLLLTSVLAVSYSISATAAEHHHHQKNSNQLVLNQGEKWAIDDSLHIGMSNIKQAISTNLDDIHHERFTTQQYADLAVTLDKHLAFLFANCKLTPLADAQLHSLLANIMQGVDKIKNADNKKQGAIIIIQSLKAYPVYFNDPNWQEL
ncbi:hypothetical protein NBRC116592_10100 [Colwellia sp. KU-HH00111]|uniref:hypothetical protein n=1 Tax=Colwellia sp. KU-HH00111 TaxID=3127652 RepID=UPI00310804A4